MSLPILKEFFKTSAIEGILVLFILGLTLLIANSSFHTAYFEFIQAPFINFHWANFQIDASFKSLINNGLMSFFFMLLALEIKREMLIGELAHPRNMILPIVSACGGILIPALIFILFVRESDPSLLRGWAIPVATDVALALGLLSLLGKRVPFALKMFLSVLAIADDLIAILIIAFFYTDHLSTIHLFFALLAILILILLNRLKITALPFYFLIGLFLWLAMHGSGIHATLAGVILGFCIPMHDAKQSSPLIFVERNLRPWVAYCIVPLFIFANAGIPLLEQASNIGEALPWGVAMGLFLGKQIGIFLTAAILIKLGATHLPKDCRWLDLYGISVLAGIGFTMSLFISNLAFEGLSFDVMSHIGILVGSGLSAIVGMGVLYFSLIHRRQPI
jgi:NhaA family Na+:H+ antiporter